MELRARAGRAVLAGRRVDAGGETVEVAPDSLPLGADLCDALHEWAQVAQVVERATANGSAGTATALVSRRGRQLAKRLAEVMGTPVRYTDPLTGEVFVVRQPPGQPAAPATPRHRARRSAPRTPWATGLTVSAFAAAVVVFAMLTLSVGLARTNPWLAVAANVMVAGGLAPSLWLGRNVLVWRWVAYGVAGGIVLAWLGLLITLAF
ncbi:DUF2537 domain-containing protein [Gandjariella thermophila]|uniref:DUF2537 domain-containing protein n=1 Tax=Gandjariella thermophila TaxID=1931992 RepID=A0A4D4J0M0_9PSEU|nr:DUF2537 domain-containing protein [Gandjariella thermophila]GDY30165.1 hypothetical protein GTS_17980 [Gandjariella thermophila]